MTTISEIRVPITLTSFGKSIKDLKQEVELMGDADRALFEVLKSTIKSAAQLHGPLGIAALTMAFMDLAEEMK